jgi:MFS transporter, AAHS family, benzoate transport protein
MTTSPNTRPGPRAVVAICALMILFDGYDLIIYGNVAPALVAEWGLAPGDVGRIGAMALVGMLLGALVAGSVSDRVGRRKVVLTSLTWFSISMAVCALAPSALVFEIARFAGGIGLGALFPTVTALVTEVSPAGKKAVNYSLTLFGYMAGGILAGVLALLLLEPVGWRSLFWFGALPVLLLPLAWKLVPESQAWLQARQDASTPRRDPQITREKLPTLGSLFSSGYARNTLLAWTVLFSALLLTYGMVNWLPSIMVQMGYEIRHALLLSLTLNTGAALGAYLAARISDRLTPKPVVITMFLIGAIAVSALTVVPSGAGIYAVMLIAGGGTIGTQVLVNVLVSSLYPDRIRGTGLGWALGVGRLGAICGPLIGGFMLTAGLAPQANFYVFAAVAVVGAIATMFILPSLTAQRATDADADTNKIAAETP